MDFIFIIKRIGHLITSMNSFQTNKQQSTNGNLLIVHEISDSEEQIAQENSSDHFSECNNSE